MSPFQLYIYLVILLAGLCFGSFLNVIIYRLPRNMSLQKPPSSCPACGKRLGILELLPLLGYLLMRARCRQCSAPISPRYPLVELATGLLFLAVYHTFGLTLSALSYLFLLFLLLAIALIDLEHKMVPNKLVGTGLLGGLVLQVPSLAAAWLELPGRLAPFRPWSDAFYGALLGGGLMLIIFLASRGGMGAGDFKLMAMIGFFVGLRGAAVVMLLGFLSGAVVGILFMALQLMTRKSAMPFAPFLSLATLVQIFWGDAIWNWYNRLGEQMWEWYYHIFC